jgi:hypothetical protein
LFFCPEDKFGKGTKMMAVARRHGFPVSIRVGSALAP